jgi:sulfate transport system substrate-binding protein
VTILAKDWDDARQKFFADNGVFDVIYKPKAQ